MSKSISLSYLLYGKLRTIVVKLYGTEDLHSIMYFLIGLCAKFITTLITYPLQLAQNMGRFKTIESLKREVNEKGYLVLFKGKTLFTCVKSQHDNALW